MTGPITMPTSEAALTTGTLHIKKDSNGNLVIGLPSPLTGGVYGLTISQSGDVSLSSLQDPTENRDAANKRYVDNAIQSGAVPITRKINNKALSADVSLSAADVGALPITGGTLTGNLDGQYIKGTWLQSTASNHLSTAATKICVQDASGWVYHRTPAEILSDIGVSAAIQSAIGNAMAASY